MLERPLRSSCLPPHDAFHLEMAQSSGRYSPTAVIAMPSAVREMSTHQLGKISEPPKD